MGNNGSGTLNIEDGGTVNNDIGRLGHGAGSTGTATVTGAGSTWTNSSTLNVGNAGSGTLTIENGGAVSNVAGFLGNVAGSSGTATVTGAGSTWTSSSDLYVGQSGSGTLTIENGGTVNNSTSVIGNSAGTTGSVTVTGTDSTWTNSSNMFLGQAGSGTLTIENGGTVTNTNAVMGTLAGSTSSATVRGTGSTWTSTVEHIVGATGNGTLTVADGGLVTSQGPLIIGQQAGSAGRLNIGAAEGNAATAAGTVAASSVVFGQGDGKIVFNHTNDAYTFAGDISGNGGVDVLSGTTILSGTNSYTGATSVRGGSLFVNGMHSGDTTVENGSTLSGNGSLGNATVLSGGTLAPGNSIGTLNTGNVSLATGSSYNVEIDANGRSDLLNSSGDVTIASGVTLNITPETIGEDGSTYAISTDYTVITANSVTGTFDTITDSFIFLDPVVRYDAANVYLRMDRNNIDYSSVARTPNQVATSQAVTSLGTASSIYQAVAMLDAATARSAFDQLSGELHASSNTLLLHTSRTAHSYADHLSSETGENIWVRFLGGRSYINSDGNASRIAQTLLGGFSGLDFAFNEHAAFGVMAGYSHSDFAINTLSSAGTTEGLHIGGYSSVNAFGIDLDFRATYSDYALDTARSVRIGSFANNLTASYDASTVSLSLEASRKLETEQGWIEPFASLSHYELRTDGFGENGGTAALSSASSTRKLSMTTLGLRASHLIETGAAVPVMLKGSVEWQHRFGDVEARSDFALAGQPTFTSHGLETARNALLLSTGLEIALGNTSHLSLGYTGEIAGRVLSHSAEMSLNLRF